MLYHCDECSQNIFSIDDERLSIGKLITHQATE